MTLNHTAMSAPVETTASTHGDPSPPAPAAVVRAVTVIEPDILPPAPKALPAPALPPVAMEAVQRILSKATRSLDYGLWYAKETRWFTSHDGTNCGVFEDYDTAVRFIWTVCPKTYRPKRLGHANE